MKRFKLMMSILTIAALLLSVWSIYELFSASGDLAQAAMNLVYFFTLFVSLLCVRISLGLKGNIALLTYLLSIIVIISSTYTWIESSELLVAGKYTLGLLPILIGTTMISNLTSDLKLSKYVQMLIGAVTLALSVCVFTGAFGASIYQILMFGMIFITALVLGLSFFVKST